MNDSDLDDALGGKRILIVDNLRATIEFYREELHRYGATTLFVASLDDAIKTLEEDQLISAVVIDLNFPGEKVPARLRPYANRLQRTVEFNQGQTLGLYIRDRYPKIPYCYLSVVPHIYDPTIGEFGDNWERFVLVKSAIPYDKLPRILVDLMGWG